MKTLRMLMVPVAFSGGLSSVALADDGSVSFAELDSLLASAGQHGFTAYEEIAVEDGGRIEMEGWRDDGWQLDVEMLLSDGSLTREAQQRSDIPQWNLAGSDVEQALNVARQSGLQRFESLDVDESGHLDIEGYDNQHREIDLRLDGSDFSVIGVDND